MKDLHESRATLGGVPLGKLTYAEMVKKLAIQAAEEAYRNYLDEEFIDLEPIDVDAECDPR